MISITGFRFVSFVSPPVSVLNSQSIVDVPYDVISRIRSLNTAGHRKVRSSDRLHVRPSNLRLIIARWKHCIKYFTTECVDKHNQSHILSINVAGTVQNNCGNSFR